MDYVRMTRMSDKTMYFGSENVVDTLKVGLNPTLTGLGDSQHFGSGFYFFENADAAEQEIGLQGLMVTHPVVMASTVKLNNPITLDVGAKSIHEALVDVTPQQVFDIMRKSERIFDGDDSPLIDWNGQSHHRLSEELITEVCRHFAKPENFWSMEKELFGDVGEAKVFREAVNEVLGYDGVVIDLGNGKENVIAWFKDQVAKMEIHKILPKPEVQKLYYRPPEPVVPELKLSR
jgi:hypothetical protein